MPRYTSALPAAFRGLTLLLLTFLSFWACQGPVPFEQVVPTPKVQQSLKPASQLPGVTAGLQSLQKRYPATAQYGARHKAGHVPTPWGLLDTTRVLALQRPGSSPYYTFVLQQTQPIPSRAFKRLLMYHYQQGHKAMLFTYTPNAAWQYGQPFSGQVQVMNLEGQHLGQFMAQGAQWQPVVPQAGTGQRGQSIETCVKNVVTYYEGNDCNGVSNTTGLPLPEELQGNCHLIIEMVYGPCNDLAGGAGPTLGGDPINAPGTSLPPTGGSSPGTSPPVIDPEEGVLTSDLAILDLSLLMELEAWGEEHINDSLVAKCVQDVLKELMNVPKIQNPTRSVYSLLMTFGANRQPAYNWNIVQGTLPPTKNAVTSSYNTATQSVTTTIDINKYRNATDLAIAATIYHECLHAFLIAEFKLNPVSSQFTYRDLLYAFDSIRNTNAAHHTYFINKYLNDVKLALQQYGNDKNYNLPDSVYIALSWKGLTGTKEFLALDKKVQDKIRDVILREQEGTDLYGRPANQSGTPHEL